VEQARKAFDNAIDKIDSLDENEYNDSTFLMQLLRNNMKLWEKELNVGD